VTEEVPWEKRSVPMPTYARAQAEARFWREACQRQADLAARDHIDRPERMAFLLGRIAEGPERPAQGVMALSYVQDEALPNIVANHDS
jgi:hypothetical protein